MVKRVRKKQRKRVRKVDWETHGDTAFSHDRIKHLRTSVMPDDEGAPEIPNAENPNGLVVSTSGPWAFVHFDDTEQLCRIDERMMVGNSSVLAPGDDVLVEPEEEQFFIRGLADRRTKLSRPAVKISRIKEQIFAANIDLLIIVVSVLKPRFKPGLVDRYLVAADFGGVEPVLCVNKMDLVDEEPQSIAAYRDLDMSVIATSCETGQGIDELREKLKGSLSVLAGHSGVGKSTLLNSLSPELDIDTQEVSDYNEKGRHTTSSSRLYKLDDGNIRIIDTPGIRQLGLWGVSHEELSYYFPELEELALKCKFRNCTHVHEPDCAVSIAIEAGEIPMRRYYSYLRIREDLEEKSRKY